FFFSSRRRHTRFDCDWSSDVCSSDLELIDPRAATDENIRRCATSVIGQIVFYHHCRPVLDKIFDGLKYDHAEIEALAKHITDFRSEERRAGKECRCRVWPDR